MKVFNDSLLWLRLIIASPFLFLSVFLRYGGIHCFLVGAWLLGNLEDGREIMKGR